MLGLGEHARIISPPELVTELLDRIKLLIDRHTGDPELSATVAPTATAVAAAGTG